jgi:hypothetical protein
VKWIFWFAMVASVFGWQHIPLVWWSIVIVSFVGLCFTDWGPLFPRVTAEQLREHQAFEARRAARWSARHPLLADALGRLGVLVVGAALIFWYVQYGPY